VQSDLFAALGDQKFDVIISNPPYVTDASMAALPGEFRCEPTLALAAGADGNDVVRRMLAEAKAHLSPGGILLVDIGHNRDLVEDAFPTLPFVWLETAAAEAGVFLLRAEDLH
jgi:ribosomal protein L3 glutamine methyltransferase